MDVNRRRRHHKLGLLGDMDLFVKTFARTPKCQICSSESQHGPFSQGGWERLYFGLKLAFVCFHLRFQGLRCQAVGIHPTIHPPLQSPSSCLNPWNWLKSTIFVSLTDFWRPNLLFCRFNKTLSIETHWNPYICWLLSSLSFAFG